VIDGGQNKEQRQDSGSAGKKENFLGFFLVMLGGFLFLVFDMLPSIMGYGPTLLGDIGFFALIAGVISYFSKKK